jgi:hypothetical protein
MAQQPLVSQGFLITEASRSHSDTPHSVGLLWTSDQPNAETSTWRHTTLTRERLPCPRRDSNSQSQQASGRRLTPQTARPLESDIKYVLLWMKLRPSHVTVSKDNNFDSSSHRPNYILFFRIAALICISVFIPAIIATCLFPKTLIVIVRLF